MRSLTLWLTRISLSPLLPNKDKSTREVPDVPFEMLTALSLSDIEWKVIARNATWQQTRMNLNTFNRHNVFSNNEMVNLVARKLTNPDEIKRAKVFPYQLMNAYLNTKDLPQQISLALQDALEIAVDNVPAIEGRVYVFPDVSGSMCSPVTGYRSGSTTAVNCVHVASLVAASILRKNRMAEVILFAHTLYNLRLNSKDSIMTNAEKMMRCMGGGTDCHLPLQQINGKNIKGNDKALILYISDNESNINAEYCKGTAVMHEWSIFKRNNPNSKMVCIDITPNNTVQAPDDANILNIAGFSDVIFNVISAFVEADGSSKGEYWVKKIE